MMTDPDFSVFRPDRPGICKALGDQQAAHCALKLLDEITRRRAAQEGE